MTEIITEKYKQSNKKPLRTMLTCSFPILAFLFLIVLLSLMPSEPVEVPEKNATQIDDKWLIIIMAIVFVVTAAITCLISYFVRRSDGFTVSDDGLSYEFTFIIKRKVRLPYDRINVIKIKRSLIDLILGLSAVKIGSGSVSTGPRAEMILIFDKKYAEYFSEYIQNRSQSIKNGERFEMKFFPPECKQEQKRAPQIFEVYNMTNGDKLRAVVTHDLFVFSMVFLLILLPIILLVRESIQTFGESGGVVVAYCFLSGIAALMIFLISLVVTYIRYYDYQIYEKDGCINVSYGLITKNSFMISHDKIRGFTISRGFFGQLFGTGKIRLCVVGLSELNSNNKNSVTYLYPCGKLNRLYEVLNKYLPEFRYEGDIQKAGKHSFLHNFIIPSAWIVVVLPPFLAIWALNLSPLVFLFLLIPILIKFIDALLLKKNIALGLSKKHLYAQSGGLYKRTSVLRMDSVQEIRTYAGAIRRKQGIKTYFISHRGDSLFADRIFVRNLPAINLDDFY